jgi:hypothetical protein
MLRARVESSTFNPRLIGGPVPLKILGARLTAAAARAGYGPPDGISRLHDEIVRHHGVTVTRQALAYWLAGERVPRLESLVGLLDALGIYGSERRALVELAHPSVRRIDSANREEVTVPISSPSTR